MTIITGRSLAVKMTIFLLGGALLVLAVILGDMYFSSRQALLAEARQNAANLAASVAHKIEQEFRAAEKIPEGIAIVLEDSELQPYSLELLLRKMVQRNDEIYGSTAAFQPYALDPHLPAYAPYYYKSAEGLKLVQLGDQGYDYFKWDWYSIPANTGRNTWSEPYFDEGGGNILMCTYSVPFFRSFGTLDAKVFQGVVTADISLEWLTELIERTTWESRSGFGFLISAKGRFISHPDANFIMKETIFSLADKSGDRELENLGRMMIGGRPGVMRLTDGLADQPAYYAFAPIPSTGWSMAVVIPEDALLEGLTELNQRAVFVAAMGILLMFLVILLVSRSVTEPIRKVVRAAERVAEGDLDVDLSDIRGNDEVGQLAVSFTSMASDLKRHIEELTQATAARERMESELNIAAQIQKSILPSTFPPFPEHEEFDLHAFMCPVREVGGDYYDFFFLDDGRLALVMADVSGKGVPAALFMMISRTLIKSIAVQGKSPGQALAEANDILCEGNETAMFVTVFLAYYDISSGLLTYANGGHNPAVVIGPAGASRDFGAQMGAALGFMEEIPYLDGSETLEKGEMLVLYTDGVTEAQSPDQVMFGDRRMRDFILARATEPLPDICRALERELEEFQQHDQFDDITMMMLRRNI